MKLDEFDYCLPEDRIAQHPLTKRDKSRMMVLKRNEKLILDDLFVNFPSFLRENDVLVVNDTKVIPARLMGKKNTGGSVEILLLKKTSHDVWETLVKPGRRAPVGEEINFFDNMLVGYVIEKTAQGGRIIKFESKSEISVDDIIEKYGQMPLPHYIKEKLEDKERYQTVYSQVKGSVAAPTAGLHFTPEVFKTLEEKGVNIAKLTLHVGLGTFRPVKVDVVEDHVMHSEYYSVSCECANTIENAISKGGKVVCVGTTSVRTLETVARKHGKITECSGWTDIFIYPGYEFKVTDALLTNFHLPKSTLIMLVSALAGREFVLSAYKEAVDLNYRFFSFGDAMLIL